MGQLRTLLPYYKPYWRGLVAGMVLVVVSNVFTIVGPFIVKLAIDGLSADLTEERIVQYALLLVGAALVAGAARYGMRELLNGISRRIETDLRNNLFLHLLRLPPQFYDRWRTGDLMSRATNDVQAVRQVAGPSIMYLVNTITIGAMALGLMIWISPRLTAHRHDSHGPDAAPRDVDRQEDQRAIRADPGAVLRDLQFRAGEPGRYPDREGVRARGGSIRSVRRTERRVPTAEHGPGEDLGSVLPHSHVHGRARVGSRPVDRRPGGDRGPHHRRRLRGVRILPGSPDVADDRRRLGHESDSAGSGVDGAHQLPPGRALHDR